MTERRRQIDDEPAPERTEALHTKYRPRELGRVIGQDDVIKSRGEKVAPKEVETVIYGLKGVREVAVIGVPDAILGQAVKALVAVDDPAITAANVLAHCRAHLEDFMVPKLIEFRDSLPKTESGKIARKELA